MGKKKISFDEFDSILNAIDQGILITDTQGVITFYNESHARMDGLKKEDVIGRKVTDVYELDNDTSLIMQSLRSGEDITNHVNIFKARNGRTVNSVSSSRLLKRKKKVTGCIACVNDWEYLDGIRNPAEAIKETRDWTRRRGYTFENIIGSNQKLLEVINRAHQAAHSPSPVLIYGKTGTGKELIAQSIHNLSGRKNKPYLAINCAAIPDNLLESILFGSTKGSFTGAIDKQGLLEQVNGGTLLLDEINSMPYPLQAKILRVLQERKVNRIGALKEVPLDIKVISSINIHPGDAMEKNQLRQDLLYRLGVVYLELPSLSERKDDIPLLVNHFISKCNEKMQKNVQSVSEQVMEDFKAYHWPGNIRELENLIESGMNMIGKEGIIQPWHLSAYSAWTTGDPGEQSGRQARRNDSRSRKGERRVERLTRALEKSGGNLTQAARQLKISRNTLYKRLNQYGLDPKEIASNRFKLKIEETLKRRRGNISKSAKDLGMSRQVLAYRLKKMGLDARAYKSRHK